MSDSSRPAGLFSSLKRLLATALEITQVRLEILRTDIELEKKRLFESLLWAAVAFLSLAVGVLLLCGFVILLFWDGYRLAAIGVMAGLFIASSVVLFRGAKTRLHNPNGLFESSLSELAQDQRGLKSKPPHDAP